MFNQIGEYSLFKTHMYARITRNIWAETVFIQVISADKTAGFVTGPVCTLSITSSRSTVCVVSSPDPFATTAYSFSRKVVSANKLTILTRSLLPYFMTLSLILNPKSVPSTPFSSSFELLRTIDSVLEKLIGNIQN